MVKKAVAHLPVPTRADCPKKPCYYNSCLKIGNIVEQIVHFLLLSIASNVTQPGQVMSLNRGKNSAEQYVRESQVK